MEVLVWLCLLPIALIIRAVIVATSDKYVDLVVSAQTAIESSESRYDAKLTAKRKELGLIS